MFNSTNGYIGDKSWRKTALFTTTGASAAGYSVTNMRNDELARVWRSATTDLADTQFSVQFTENRTIRSIALCNINFTNPTAQCRFTFYAADGSTVLYTSPWLAVWEQVYDANDPQASWDSGNWWNRTLSTLDTQNRYIDKCFYFDAIFCRKFKVEISDEDNANGFVQIGVCDPADGIDLSFGVGYGAKYGIVPRSRVTQAMGGAKYTEAEVPTDSFVGAIADVEQQTMSTQIYEFLRRTDLHTLFWFTLDKEDKVNELRHSYLARNAEIDLITKSRYNRDDVVFNFERVL